ncbi:MAG: hypothetical protein ACRC0Y_04815 [Fusobacteriaceae bacterium]
MLLEEWNRKLVSQSKKLIKDSYYMVDTAMEKVWDRNYDSIVCDDEIEIEEIRSVFWSEGFDELEVFSNEIIEAYEERYEF